MQLQDGNLIMVEVIDWVVSGNVRAKVIILCFWFIYYECDAYEDYVWG